MITKLFSLVFLLIWSVGLAGCNSAKTQQNPVVQQQAPRSNGSGQVATSYADGIRRVTIAEFEELKSREDVFIVDVRNQAAYDSGHIPGAKLIPVGDVGNRVSEFPRDKTIVTYCS